MKVSNTPAAEESGCIARPAVFPDRSVLSKVLPYSLFAMVFFMYMINTADRSALSVALPALKSEFHLSMVQLGWLSSSFLWSYIALNLPSGIFLDRKGARATGSLAVGLWSGAMIASAFVRGLPQFLMTRVALGIGEAPTFPLGSRIVRDWARPDQRGTVMTVMLVGMQLGIGAGALGGAVLIAYFGWRAEFLCLGALGFLWAVLWWVIFPPSHSARSQRMEPWKKNRALTKIFASRSFWSILTTMCVTNFCNFILISWMPVYLIGKLRVGLISAGGASAACYAAAGVLGIIFSRIGDRMIRRFAGDGGARRWPVAVFLVGGSSIGLLPFVSGAMVVALLTFAIGCMGAANGGNIAMLTDLLVDGSKIGAVMGLILTFSNLAGLIAPVLTGYIVAATGGFAVAWALGSLGLLIGAALAVRLARSPIVLS